MNHVARGGLSRVFVPNLATCRLQRAGALCRMARPPPTDTETVTRCVRCSAQAEEGTVSTPFDPRGPRDRRRAPSTDFELRAPATEAHRGICVGSQTSTACAKSIRLAYAARRFCGNPDRFHRRSRIMNTRLQQRLWSSSSRGPACCRSVSSCRSARESTSDCRGTLGTGAGSRDQYAWRTGRQFPLRRPASGRKAESAKG